MVVVDAVVSSKIVVVVFSRLSFDFSRQSKTPVGGLSSFLGSRREFDGDRL